MILEVPLLASLIRRVYRSVRLHRCDGCGEPHAKEFLLPRVGIVCESCLRRDWTAPIRVVCVDRSRVRFLFP